MKNANIVRIGNCSQNRFFIGQIPAGNLVSLSRKSNSATDIGINTACQILECGNISWVFYLIAHFHTSSQQVKIARKPGKFIAALRVIGRVFRKTHI